jgi:hypothetical protein
MEGKKKEVIPGVTEHDIDIMADLVFGRLDGNHPDLADSGDIARILGEGGKLADESPAFLRKVKL